MPCSSVPADDRADPEVWSRRELLVAGVCWLGTSSSFLRASMAEVVTQMDLSTSLRQPAGLMLDTAVVDQLRSVSGTGSVSDRLLSEVHTQADLLLETPPLEREMQTWRLLPVSREFLRRMTNLSLTARVTEDPRYLDRAQAEADAVLGFEDWNPRHFLDVGEMSAGLAFGLAWLSPMLSADTRDRYRAGLHQHALSVARDQIETDTAKWLRAHNNIAQVCGAGLVLACLVAWEDDPETCQLIVESVLRTLPKAPMQVYAPDGTFPEGYSYWNYGTLFTLWLCEGLQDAYGHDFGLLEQPGFLRSAQYINAATPPSLNGFAYSDFFGELPMEAMCWFATRGGRPEAWYLGERWMERYLKERAPRSRYLAATAIWALDLPQETPSRPPLSWMGRGTTPMASHRSSWDDADAVWIGSKGGQANTPHGHADIGGFEYEAAGVRWAIDLGVQRYHLLEEFGLKVFAADQDGDRWKIFRMGPWAHNILMIDDQRPPVEARGEIVNHHGEGDSVSTQWDLTPLYPGRAERVLRTVGLDENRQTGVIEDVIEDTEPGLAVRWAMTTRAAIHLDGESIALTQGDAHLDVAVRSNSAFTPEDLDISEPVNPWDEANPGVRQLLIHTRVPDSGKLTLRVELRPQR